MAKKPGVSATLEVSLAFYSLGILSTGCAGPTTPLGAVWAFTRSSAEASANAFTAPKSAAPLTDDTRPHIRFSPARQVLYGPSPLRIRIDDPTGDVDNYQVAIHYNGLDVTRAFLLHADVHADPAARTVRIENPLVRLTPDEEHKIEVFYVGSTGAMSYASYEGPRCYAFRPSPVVTLADFTPPIRILKAIQSQAGVAGLSPSFFTALVAQESGFNPDVVSWARALGLTQITSNAEAEFIDKYHDWPRYPGISDMSFPAIKALMIAGKINARSEWRLDPERSIQGGIDYTVLLAAKWSSPERLAKIRALFTDPEEEHTKLILASYHSGFSRVLAALDRYGRNWLQAPDLHEARKYVNRISSYCDSFSQGEADHETSS